MPARKKAGEAATDDTREAQYLGEFEHLVLLAVVRLGSDAYGVRIRRTIAERAERSVSFGAVYSTLRRLVKKGYLQSHSDENNAGTVGRPRTFFSLTDPGHDALRQARRRIERMSEGIRVHG